MDNLYDIVFYLVGEQRIPNLMGVLHITAKKNMCLLKQINILLSIFIVI